METIADRLRALREKANLSQEAMGNKIGVTASAVHYWENSNTEPNSKNILAIAQVFNCSAEWLMYGIQSEPKNKVDIVITPGHNSKRMPFVDRIPVLEWQESKDINEIRKIHMQKSQRETIPCFDDCSADSFAHQIKNDMMVSNVPNTPSFPIGVFIVIDPHLKPKDGSFVLVDVEGYPEALFYQYILIGGKPHFKTLNTQYPPQKYSESTKIIGTLAYSYQKHF